MQNLHSLLVLSHKLGGELAQDVEESQVERRASFSLGTRVLKCKFDTIPRKFKELKRKTSAWWGKIYLFEQRRRETNISMHHPWLPSLSILREIMDEIHLEVQVPKS